MPLLSIVIPVYNEEQALPAFHAALIDLLNTLPHEYEILYVAGGSTDRTSDLITQWHAQNQRVKLLELSRNYGHQAALTAGLDYATGDIIITMDGDGQHPPAVLPHLLREYENGADVVLTQRSTTENISPIARFFSVSFYRLINWLSESEVIPNSSDFRLLSREVVDDLHQMREQHRFLRGMIVWMGYRRAIVTFDAPARTAGKSKFSFRKRLKLAADAIFSFSITPIILVIMAGLVVLTFALLYVVYLIILVLTIGLDGLPPGWASLMLAILSLGGMQLITTGLIGYYVGMSFQESKRRPIYFVNKRVSRLEDDPTKEDTHERR